MAIGGRQWLKTQGSCHDEEEGGQEVCQAGDLGDNE